MKILVLSDTHIPNMASDLPGVIYEYAKGVDMILHAGDITGMSLIEQLKKFAPVHAVQGNMDDWDVKKELPQKKIIDAGKFKIGLVHGWGSPSAIQKAVFNEFSADGVDCIVFGHSHKALNIRHNNTLLFNPGSPTDKVFTNENSFGILDINDSITASIIRI